MMKKSIVFGSLLTIFLFLMMPLIPAVHIQTTTQAITQNKQNTLNPIPKKITATQLIQLITKTINNLNEKTTIRLIGLILLIIHKNLRRSMNILGRIYFRIAVITLICASSLIMGIFITDASTIQILFRLMLAFFYALLMPILFKAECLNLIIFAREAVGLIGRVYILLRYYGFYNDQATH